MLIWLNLTGAVAVILALTSAALPLAAVENSWPAHVSARRLRVESNAVRLARGLSPLTPARLYNPERVHTGGTFDFITATDDDDALSQCSTFAAGKSAATFALAYAGYGYECEAGAKGNGGTEQCNTNDWAVYSQ